MIPAMSELKLLARAYGAALSSVALLWSVTRQLLVVLPLWARAFHFAVVFLYTGIGMHATFLLIRLCVRHGEFASDFARPNPLHFAASGMQLTAALFSLTGPFLVLAALVGLGRFRRKLAGLFRVLVFPVGLLYPPVFVTWSGGMPANPAANSAAWVASLLLLILGYITLRFYRASCFDALWTPDAN